MSADGVAMDVDIEVVTSAEDAKESGGAVEDDSAQVEDGDKAGGMALILKAAARYGDGPVVLDPWAE